MCLLICCFNIPGVTFCLGYRCSALLFIHPALGTVNDPKCSDMKDCYLQTKQGAEKQFALLGQKQLDMLMLDYPADENCDSIRGQWKAFEDTVLENFLAILRWSWNRWISKHQLLLAWESIFFCSPHQSTKLPINHPKTIQTSIRPFLWHDEQLKFTPFNSKCFIYFHDTLPVSKRFKWNSYIDGNPRCLQLFFSHGIGDLCCQTCSEYCCETLGSKQTNHSPVSCFWRTGCFIGKFGTAFWEYDTVTCFELFGWAETSGRRVLHYLSMQKSHEDHRLMSEDACESLMTKRVNEIDRCKNKTRWMYRSTYDHCLYDII